MADVDGTAAQGDFQDIDFNSEVSASLGAAAHKFFKVSLPIAAFTNPDLKSVRAWKYTSLPGGSGKSCCITSVYKSGW